MTDSQGEPVSIQVYRGNTSDLKTFALTKPQIQKANTYLEEHPRAKVATQHRHLAARLASFKVEVTVEEGLAELEQFCVIKRVHPRSGKVVTRQVPEPSARQKLLLDALQWVLPSTVPEAQVTVGTCKKIDQARKRPVN